MKSIKLLLSVLTLAVMVSTPALRAQDDAKAPPPPGAEGGKGGKGGGRGMMSPDERVAQIDKAVTLTADQKAKIKDILTKEMDEMKALSPEERRGKMRESMKATHDAVRAVLTADQQTKFDAMPQPGRGGKKKGGE